MVERTDAEVRISRFELIWDGPHTPVAEPVLLGVVRWPELAPAVALEIAIRRPALVRRLVVISLAYRTDGLYPEVLGGEKNMKPGDLNGTPWQAEYARIAPNPESWPALVEKAVRLDLEFEGWPTGAVRSIGAPTLIVIGDADIVRPEHAVELLRLLGGGVPGDLAGLPRSRLAVLPGTTHVTMMERADWLAPMIAEFLDATLPGAP